MIVDWHMLNYLGYKVVWACTRPDIQEILDEAPKAKQD
jgi:hypothetical protein